MITSSINWKSLEIHTGIVYRIFCLLARETHIFSPQGNNTGIQLKGAGKMDISPEQYRQYVQQKAKKSPIVKNVILAFVIGGAICVLGQLILNGWTAAGLSEEDASTATSVSLVFLSALTTGLNLYNKLARFGGAGTLVPITGFANAVVAPAIDFKSEGFVTGMAAKMFLIAGPVIVFGTLASALYGVILMLSKLA